MPNAHARLARHLTVLAAGEITDDGLQWIEVMPTADKARNGPWYFTITADDLETYAQSIRDRPDQIPVDYDHGGSDNSTRAAGWFTGQAEVRDVDGSPRLFAQVRWTPTAIREIREGEFRRISPEFSFVDKDKKTGLMTRAKELLAATLTNQPFFRELAPVGQEVVWQADEGFQRIQQLVYAALNPGPMDSARYWVMDVAPGKALVSEYSTSRTFVVPFTLAGDVVELAPAAEWTEAEQEWVAAAREAIRTNNSRRPFTTTEGDDDMPDLKAIAVALGLAEDADEDTITAALKERDEKITTLTGELEAAKAKGDDGSETEVEALRKELQVERTKRLDSERETILAQAVRDRKIVPAEKEHLAKAYGEDMEALRAYVDVRPAASGPAGSGSNNQNEPEGDDDKAVADARGNLTYKSAAGEFEADEDSLRLHVAAEKLLAEEGKPRGKYTESDYTDALLRVSATATA